MLGLSLTQEFLSYLYEKDTIKLIKFESINFSSKQNKLVENSLKSMIYPLQQQKVDLGFSIAKKLHLGSPKILEEICKALS